MKNLHKQKTSKLFYNKFPYKISCFVLGINKVKYYGILGVINLLNLNHTSSGKNLQHLLLLLSPLIEQKLIKTRLEGSYLNIFLEDKALFESLTQDLSQHIVKVWEPHSDTEKKLLTENSKLTIVDRYPYECYTHKVFFKNIPTYAKLEIYNWLNQHKEIFKISKSTAEYLKGRRQWIQSPFVYVSDPKMITMMLLTYNQYIGHIEKFVLRSSINT